MILVFMAGDIGGRLLEWNKRKMTVWFFVTDVTVWLFFLIFVFTIDGFQRLLAVKDQEIDRLQSAGGGPSQTSAAGLAGSTAIQEIAPPERGR
jgi:hypothetical protein